jgi:methyl-accepting chemotaxis protein
METGTKKWIIGGSILSFFAGGIYLASNKEKRDHIVGFVSDTSNQAKHWITVINENRDTVVEQIRQSSDKISSVVEAASEDIEKLMDTTQNMKTHVVDLLVAIQDSTDELKGLKDKLHSEELIEAKTSLADDEPDRIE